MLDPPLAIRAMKAYEIRAFGLDALVAAYRELRLAATDYA